MRPRRRREAPVPTGRMRWTEITERLAHGGTWVEVGVYRGLNARLVMTARPDARLVAVDPWRSPLGTGATWGAIDDEPTTMCFRDQAIWDSWERSARDALAPFADRTTILHMTSAEAAALMAELRPALVFVDADHSYEACAADIRLWAPLVAPGGWLGGHDYGKARFPGVTRAVDELCGAERVECGADSTWWVRR